MVDTACCPFCGSAMPVLLYRLTDIRRRLPGEYRLVRCVRCGLQYLDPQPSDEVLKQYYSQEYHCFAESPRRGKAFRAGLNRRCQIITSRIQEGGRLLDVGCATGTFLEAMRSIGNWQVEGIEPAEPAARYAREVNHLAVVTGTLEQVPFLAGSFDALTFWDVLEHIRDPLMMLKRAADLIRPGGWLVIKVPDPCSPEAHLFGSTWAGYEAPLHLFLYPKKVLVERLRSLGFRNISFTQVGSEYETFAFSLVAWLRQKGKPGLSQTVERLQAKPWVRFIMGPIVWGLRFIGFTASYTLICQKADYPA